MKALVSGELLSVARPIGLPSACVIDVYDDGARPVVVMTEVEGNTGASVTNASEYVAAVVKVKYARELAGREPRWIEHYPATLSVSGADTYDEVTYSPVEGGGVWDGHGTPSWRNLRQAELSALLRELTAGL